MKQGSAQARPEAGAAVAFGPPQARWVAASKAAEFVTRAAFAVVVPRLMGPVMYGEFALLLVFVALMPVVGCFGALYTFGRFVPEYRVRESVGKIQVLFTQMLALRLTFAVALIVPLVLALTSLLPDASQVTVAAAVAAVGVSTVGATFYELLHGLNALGRWLLPNALSVGVLLILILALGGGGSLDVAALALLAAHGLFFVLGLYWTRGYLTWTPSVLDWRFFAEHLRFGLLLFLGGLLMMAILRSGEIVVATLSGNPMEIAYFNLAGLVMFTMYALIDQLSSSIIPTLAKFRASGEEHKVARWLGYSLTYFSALTFAFLLLTLGAGHWIVAAVWGSEFLPVANNLIALAAGLLAAPIIVVTNSLAMVYNRPEKFAPLSGAGLLLFLGSSVLTVPAWGALGASISVALGLGCAAVFAYILFRRLGILDVLSVSRFHIQAGAGLATLAVFAVPWGTSIVRAAICLGLYLALLFLTGILGREDIRHAARLLGGR